MKLVKPEEKTFLLSLARDSISYYFQNQKIFSPALPPATLSPFLYEQYGVFVTLTKERRLRGCIGTLQPQFSLHETVQEFALRSAFEDKRFTPLLHEELPEVQICISVLFPSQPATHNEIILGKHGIVLSKKGKSAVFLPQVPREQGWNLETSLSNLCTKAGLGPDEWKKGCQFQVFEGIEISE